MVQSPSTLPPCPKLPGQTNRRPPMSSWGTCRQAILTLFLSLAAVLSLRPLAGASVDNAGPDTWAGPDGHALPFQNHDEVLEFLRTARVISYRPIGRGINDTRKLLLERNGITAHGVFRDVRMTKERVKFRGEIRLFFRDDARFEAAAYELSRILGLQNVPPTVVRSLFGRQGTVQLWIENACTEAERIRGRLWPEDMEIWRMQIQVLRLFDNLIFNEDRNLGNMLFDPQWKLWLIDHTRAFRRDKRLPYPHTLTRCDRSVWEHLTSRQPQMVSDALREYLHPAELRGLLERWELVVAHIERMIEDRGEEAVLFDLPLVRTARQEFGPKTTTEL